MLLAIGWIKATTVTTVTATAGAVLGSLSDKGWDDVSWDNVWRTAAFTALVTVLGIIAGRRATAGRAPSQ